MVQENTTKMTFTEQDQENAKKALLIKAIRGGDQKIRQNMIDCVRKGMIKNMNVEKLNNILDYLEVIDIHEQQKGVINAKRGYGASRDNDRH